MSDSKILYGIQDLNDYRYKVTDLIEATKNEKVFKLKVSDVFTHYVAPCEDTLTDFIDHVKRTMQADLNFPIILSPDNFILDGKHRLAKALVTGEKYIKAVRIKSLAGLGTYVGE